MYWQQQEIVLHKCGGKLGVLHSYFFKEIMKFLENLFFFLQKKNTFAKFLFCKQKHTKNVSPEAIIHVRNGQNKITKFTIKKWLYIVGQPVCLHLIS